MVNGYHLGTNLRFTNKKMHAAQDGINCVIRAVIAVVITSSKLGVYFCKHIVKSKITCPCGLLNTSILHSFIIWRKF